VTPVGDDGHWVSAGPDCPGHVVRLGDPSPHTRSTDVAPSLALALAIAEAWPPVALSHVAARAHETATASAAASAPFCTWRRSA
jgi:hypothetical protein